MIEFTKAYVVNGKTFATLKEAQEEELLGVLCVQQDHACGMDAQTAAARIIENKDRVIDILTTKESSKPTARRINGGRKPRKKSESTPNAVREVAA